MELWHFFPEVLSYQKLAGSRTARLPHPRTLSCLADKYIRPMADRHLSAENDEYHGLHSVLFLHVPRSRCEVVPSIGN